jgi:hypothetical protein
MSGPHPHDAGSPPPQDRVGPPYQPPYGTGYPYAAYGYAAGYAREHPQGTAVLILGIVSVVACGLAGPFAWVMGNNAMRDVEQYPYAYTNRNNIQAGRILGIIGTVLLALQVLFVVGILVLALIGASTGT